MIKECQACGYKQGKDWININDPFPKSITIGDEEFIEIIGSFHKSTRDGEKRVWLSACPKCKTVILEE